MRPLIKTLCVVGIGTLITACGNGGGGGQGSGPPGTLGFVGTTVDTTEGTIINIRVARSGGSSGAASVDYATADGSAQAGSDYTAVSGTLTWPDGVSGNRTVSIQILDEDLEEPEESFALTLSNASGATLGSETTATINIAANDASARLSDLSFSAGEFDQLFQPSVTSYSATVGFLVPTTTVTPATDDAAATVTVDGVSVPQGQPSGKITLSEGTTSIEIVVTAADGASSETYTINVTRETVASFAQQAYIKASNTDAGDQFGFDVALHGDTLAVGAWWERSGATGVNGDQSDNSARGAGAVYVFNRDGSGVWSQQAYLKASNTDPDDIFGWRIALDEDTLVVGAPSEASGAIGVDGNQSDNSAGRAGAVYVFVRDASGVWSQQAYLKASNTDPGDDFGHAVTVDGDTLAVGAWLESSSATGVNGLQLDNSAAQSGAAYVFTRDASGVWSQQAYIKASNTDSDDLFGHVVALDGDTLAVGAQRERSNATGVNGDQLDNSAGDAGAVYVFTRDMGGTWSQQAYIKASNTGPDLFGHAISVHNDTLAVGSLFEGSSATGIDGDQLDNSAGGAGAVYVFTRDGSGAWSQQAYVKASNTFAANSFGEAVTLKLDILAVGARYESSGSTGINGDQNQGGAGNSGAVYVFTRDASSVWSQQAFVKASNTDSNDQFGLGISLDGETLAIGAAREDSSGIGLTGDESDNSAENAGAVYLFE